jgi:Recombinase
MSERTKPLESDWARMPDPAGAVERMRMARKEQAAQFAANVLPIIRDIQKAGHTSLNAIAGQLNARKVATANGGQWRHVQVRQILGRAGAARRTAVPGRVMPMRPEPNLTQVVDWQAKGNFRLY